MKDYASLTDEQLALLYVGGDFRAFDLLLERNQQKLYSYILFVVHDPEVANDIFQETFVKVITKLQDGKYTDSGKFNFWLSRIAHNVIMDTYRHQKNSHIVEPTEDNDLNKLRSNDLITAQREVVYMRYYQDLSFKEIAEITGVSINTSLGRMRYALINMRRMAKEHHIQLNMEL